jgi:hypothetical protein
MHYGVQETELAGLAGETARIRLEKVGGGSGHIDSIALDGRAPRAAAGADLAKASRIDDDVVDATAGPVEFEFAGPFGDSVVISLCARIEPVVISKVPFQFPAHNTFRPMTERSAFYTYELGSREGKLTVDGEIAGEGLGRPLFDEYIPVGSGHPQGSTLAWVRDDGEHLYVAMDFTPDNTMDGNLDYAKVYAKTTDGLREFAVSVKQREWGSPGFTYTDKVEYQHKIYEFEIPLAEVADSKEAGTPLLLAFAAYGTASPMEGGKCVAYNTVVGEYLLAYARSDEYYYIASNTYDATGDVLTWSTVSQTTEEDCYPAVATDPAGGGYLVVWEQYNMAGSPDYRALGRGVASTGAVVGTEFRIDVGTSEQQNPAVAFDSVNSQYLVVWADDRSGSSTDVYGRLVDTAGSVLGASFLVMNLTDAGTLAAAFDSVNEQFLVTAYDFFDDNIYRQVIDADGSAVGTTDSVTASGSYTHNVAFSAADGQYLVVWSPSNEDIHGRLIAADGTLAAGTLTICDAALNQYSPSVAFEPASGLFLVAWQHQTESAPSRYSIWGRFVRQDGSMRTASHELVARPGYVSGLSNPSVVANTDDGEFGVGFQVSNDLMGIAIVAPPAAAGGGGGGDDGGCVPGAGSPAALLLVASIGIALVRRRRSA